MRTRSRTRAAAMAAAPSLLPLAGLTAASGVALWAVAMIRREALVSAYGPICSIHHAGALHCPSCYAAVGLVASAAAMAATALRRAAK